MNIGDYVRTKYGIIGKVVKEEPFMDDINVFLDNNKGNITLTTKDGVFKVNKKEDVLKSSPNIIDLIEVGDYVNGNKVTGIDYEYTEEKHKLILNNDYGQRGLWLENSNIKSILTKVSIKLNDFCNIQKYPKRSGRTRHYISSFVCKYSFCWYCPKGKGQYGKRNKETDKIKNACQTASVNNKSKRLGKRLWTKKF